MSTNVIVGLPGGPLGPSLASLWGSVPCRLGLILGLSTAEAPYVQGVIARASPGLARLLWTLPLILLHTVAPLALDCREAILEKVVVMFLLTWLANFKVRVHVHATCMHTHHARAPPGAFIAVCTACMVMGRRGCCLSPLHTPPWRSCWRFASTGALWSAHGAQPRWQPSCASLYTQCLTKVCHTGGIVRVPR